MNSLFHECSAAIVSKTSCLVGSHSICRSSGLPWKANFSQASFRSVNLNSFLEGVYIRSYSSKKSRRNSSLSQKSDHSIATTPAPIMEEETNAFFVVRKGDLVGIYRSLSDCQTQVGSSVSNPISLINLGENVIDLLVLLVKNALHNVFHGSFIIHNPYLLM